MDGALWLLGQADAKKIAKQAESFFQTAKAWAYEHWYISIPAVFVLAFVVMIYWAKWKWSKV